jgi:serine/threonine-protein kinase
MKTCPACEQEWPDDTKFCPNDGTPLRADTENEDLIGSLIAERYHILEKLGEGGMGAVYLAEHVKMGLKVAVKVMSQALSNDVDAIARFHREARNSAQIKHPNVCGVLDFGETPDGLIYLAMEFVEGEPLTNLLQREGAISPKRTARILSQCCDALQAAHDLDIVHRDLKPDNIMITKTREGGDFVKIVDFGIAKAMMAEDGQTVTKTGHIVGTPEYMSPEQVSGELLDGRSDTYSLALVLFRMLTGSLPFHADTPQESLTSRLVADPLKLQQAAPGVEFPEQLQQLMDQALARSRDRRFSSAVEFAQAVEAVLSGMPDPIPHVDVDAPTYLLDSAAVVPPPTPETPVPARRENTKKSSHLPPVVILASAAIVVVGGIGITMMLRGGPESPAADATSPEVGEQQLAANTTDAGAEAPQVPPEEVQTPERTRDRGAQVEAQRSQQDIAFESIEQLIAEGRVSTALERLDLMRAEDITNERVNGLIERAVRSEINDLVARTDYDGAIASLTDYLESRPYLEHMDTDLEAVYLAKLDAAIEEDEYGVPGAAFTQIENAFPRDAETLYQASLRMAESGWLAYALEGFLEVLAIDEKYREREPILSYASSALNDGWISNIQHSAQTIIGEHFLGEYRPQLIDNLHGENSNLRLNSFLILRRFSRDELADLDLFEFHRLNLVQINDYRNRGQPFDWAIDYMEELTDQDRIQRAISALEIVMASDSVASATAILRECQETIDSLRRIRQML